MAAAKTAPRPRPTTRYSARYSEADRAKAATRAPVAFSYLRFSDPKQETGDSITRQTTDAREWCERNNIPLDTALTLASFGVSALKGLHRLNPDEQALALFLELAKEGERVRPGDYLVIENLDRLSREEEVPATNLLTSILMTGVNVVQVKPELVLTRTSDGFTIMRAVMELSRGHGESARKVERNGAAWGSKKAAARDGKSQPPRRNDGRVTSWLTDRLPAWVVVRQGELALHPTRAAAVKRVFQLAAVGLGCRAIATRLDKEGVPAFGTATTTRVTRTLKRLFRRRLDEYRLPLERLERVGGRNGNYTAPCPLHEPGAGPGLTLTRGADGQPATLSCSAGCDPAAVLGVLGLNPADLVPRWDHCYIADLLSDRRAVGEFQLRDGNGKPSGAPLAGYFPPAVTESEWKDARAAKDNRPAARRQAKGRFSKGTAASPGRGDGDRVNLFAGLVKDALAGGTYRVVIRKGKDVVLIRSVAAAGYPGEPARSFPLPTFEKAILGLLSKEEREGVMPREERPPSEELKALEKQLAKVRAELTAVNADLDANGHSDGLSRRMRALEAKEKDLQDRSDRAARKAARPPDKNWEEFVALATEGHGDDAADARLRLRAALRRVVDRIWLLVTSRGHDRLAAAQVCFTGGARRDYLIWHRRPRSNGKKRVDGFWKARSVTADEQDRSGLYLIHPPAAATGTEADEYLPLVRENLDNADHAAYAEEYLASLTPDDLARLVFRRCEEHPLP